MRDIVYGYSLRTAGIMSVDWEFYERNDEEPFRSFYGAIFRPFQEGGPSPPFPAEAFGKRPIDQPPTVLPPGLRGWRSGARADGSNFGRNILRSRMKS